MAGSETLTIRIFDQAGIPEQELEKALPVAHGIFQRAGINTDWRTCRVLIPEGACEPIGHREVLVKVVAENRGPQAEAFGSSLREGRKGILAYIFYGHVGETAARGAFSPGVLLALVLSHEVAHLFGLEHCVGSVMKEGFGRLDVMQASAGALSFDPVQARRLVRAVRFHLAPSE